MEWSRAILHADMDAFYASVEQLDHPEWRGKPLIVAGSPQSRGVVSAASYEARSYGLRSGLPTAQAMRLYPKVIRTEPRHARYAEISRQMYHIFQTITPIVEGVSIDEAFLEVTKCQRLYGEPETIARRLKESVKRETSLTVSVGVAANRFVAKMASGMNKPDGLTVIRPEEAAAILAPLPARKLWGIGPACEKQLDKLGITTVGELACYPEDILESVFGKRGIGLAQLAQGIDYSEVVTEGEAKSISREITFERDVILKETLEAELLRQADDVMRRAREAGLLGRTATLKIRYSDFTTFTRRETKDHSITTALELYEITRRLLNEKTLAGKKPVRLIGIALSGWDAHVEDGIVWKQENLFEGIEKLLTDKSDMDLERMTQLELAADSIRKKLGDRVLTRAALLSNTEDDTD